MLLYQIIMNPDSRDGFTPSIGDRLVPLGGFGFIHGDLLKGIKHRICAIERERGAGVYGYITGDLEVRQDLELGSLIFYLLPDGSGQVYLDETAKAFFAPEIAEFKDTHGGSISRQSV